MAAGPGNSTQNAPSTCPRRMTMTKFLSLFISLILLFVSLLLPSTGAFSAALRLASHRPSTTPPLRAFTVMTDAVTNFFQTEPYVSAFLTCSIKASAADFVAQGRQQQQEEEAIDATENFEHNTVLSTPSSSSNKNVDFSRNLAFFTYGGIYQGCTQQFIFCNIYPTWFGSWDVVPRITAQVALDIFVLAPFLCLPAAYCIRSIVCSANDDEEGNHHRHPLQHYWNDVVHQQLIFKYWALWAPVNAIAFGVVPTHFRVAFIAAVSFFWVLVLSTLSSSKNETE